jgi:hypothetical protein
MHKQDPEAIVLFASAKASCADYITKTKTFQWFVYFLMYVIT